MVDPLRSLRNRVNRERDAWRGSPLAVVYIIVVWTADLVARDDAVFIGFLALAPLFAAAVDSVRRTAAVAGLAVVIAVGAGLYNDMFGSVDHLLRVVVVIAVGITSVYVSRSRNQREERLRRLTEIARVSQQAVLRPVPARVGDVELAARYLSAYEAAQVGGDLYEVIESPYGVRVIMGDVCGKGLEAVRLASTVMGAFRQSAFVRTELVDVVRDLDGAVVRDPVRAPGTNFVTAVLVEFGADEVRVANCGHPPPILRTARGELRLLRPGSTAPPLGLGRGAVPEIEVHPWRAGDRALLYTDGLIEARDQTGSFIPRLRVYEALAAGGREEVLNTLLSCLLGHVGGRPRDDIALLVAERPSGSPTAKPAAKPAAEPTAEPAAKPTAEPAAAPGRQKVPGVSP